LSFEGFPVVGLEQTSAFSFIRAVPSPHFSGTMSIVHRGHLHLEVFSASVSVRDVRSRTLLLIPTVRDFFFSRFRSSPLQQDRRHRTLKFPLARRARDDRLEGASTRLIPCLFVFSRSRRPILLRSCIRSLSHINRKCLAPAECWRLSVFLCFPRVEPPDCSQKPTRRVKSRCDAPLGLSPHYIDCVFRGSSPSENYDSRYRLPPPSYPD